MKRLRVVAEGRWWLAMMLWAALPSFTWAQAFTGLRPYDTFTGALIDPSKWVAQWQCGGTVLECVREIQNRQLHLRVRAYGDMNVNGGGQFGASELYLKSGMVTDLVARVTVRRAAAASCSTGTGASHAQALLFGAFFNGGSGTASDDLHAFLQFDRYSSDPPGVARVGGFLNYQGQFFSNVDLGPVNVGEQVRVELAWDQPNHRFAARLFKPASNTLLEQYMPYAVSDSAPAVAPFKSLSARAFPVNCLGQQSSADMDVLFDNVMTN